MHKVPLVVLSPSSACAVGMAVMRARITIRVLMLGSFQVLVGVLHEGYVTDQFVKRALPPEMSADSELAMFLNTVRSDSPS